jgi:hypothetical protein
MIAFIIKHWLLIALAAVAYFIFIKQNAAPVSTQTQLNSRSDNIVNQVYSVLNALHKETSLNDTLYASISNAAETMLNQGVDEAQIVANLIAAFNK